MKRKFTILIAILALFYSPPIRAQSGAVGNLTAASTNCAATSSCIESTVPLNIGGATFKLSGTFSATVQFEATADPLTVQSANALWVAISATPSSSATTATSATATGVWQVNIAAYTRIRIRVSAFTSGTVAAAINFSTASARGGSGGGAGGTVTNVTGTLPITSSGGVTPDIACPTCVTTPGGGSIAGGTNQVAVFSSPSTLGSSSNLFFNNATGKLNVLNTCSLTAVATFTFCNPGSGASYGPGGTQLASFEFIQNTGALAAQNVCFANGAVAGNTGTSRAAYTCTATGNTGAFVLRNNISANSSTTELDLANTTASTGGVSLSASVGITSSIISGSAVGVISLTAFDGVTAPSVFTLNPTGNATLAFAAGLGLTFSGSTSGGSTISAAAAAGTPNRLVLPIATGGAGTFLQTDGANPQQLSWATPSTVATSVPFSGITGATNSTAAMVIGTGASLTTSGTGSLATTTPFVNSASGAASVSAESLTGSFFSGGSATTTFPFWYINQGSAVSSWSTSGTLIGVNLNSAFTGAANIMDFHYNGGASIFKVGANGSLTTTQAITASSIAVTSFNQGATFNTATNCSDSAGAAACGSAAAGTFVVDAGATTTVVSTTATTANSEIFVQYDSSLGTRLSVTCNVTVAIPQVTARTAATSFTVTVPVAPVANPACYSYHIIN